MSAISSVADALKTLLDGLSFDPPLKTYRWSPRDLDDTPAAVIELPRIERGGPDTTENAPLGLNGWLLDFPVSLYFELDIAQDTQARAVEYVNTFITAVDDNPGLSLAGVLDSAVVASEPVVIDDRTRVLIAYECRVEVLIEVVDNDP